MEDFFMALWPYVPFLIFLAAFFDTLCFTGLFFYGGGMVGTVLAFYVSGAVSIPEIVLAAIFGTLLGSLVNFYLGRYGSTRPSVQKFLAHKRAQTVTNFVAKRHILTVVITGRFITITRPFYALLLGAAQTSPYRFFAYEIPVVITWVFIWLLLLLQGEKLLRYFFSL